MIWLPTAAFAALAVCAGAYASIQTLRLQHAHARVERLSFQLAALELERERLALRLAADVAEFATFLGDDLLGEIQGVLDE